MTREEIEQLDGEELAAAVAEKVMRWKLRPVDRAWIEWERPYHVHTDWRPDRDIAQAFEVMRAVRGVLWSIRELGMWVVVRALPDDPERKPIEATADVIDGDKTRACCIAICRTAWIVVEDEDHD
jgi:hypothetical protein